MGSAASASPQHHPAPQSHIPVVSATVTRVQARAQPVPVPLPCPHTGGSEPKVLGLPVVRSLVDLWKGNCEILTTAEGAFLTFTFSSSSGGEAKAFLLPSAVDRKEPKFGVLEAAQVSVERFSAGSNQRMRLFLSADLHRSLEGTDENSEKTGRYPIALELCGETGIAPRCVTDQRSFLKAKADGKHWSVHVAMQIVRCGPVVKKIEQLYSHLPNPRRPTTAESASRRGAGGATSAGAPGDAEGRECVICLEKPKEVCILQCRHVCLCRSCAEITSSTWSFQCPVCRGRVAKMVHATEASPVLEDVDD